MLNKKSLVPRLRQSFLLLAIFRCCFAAAQSHPLRTLFTHLQAIEKQSGGTLGVAAMHLPSGQTVSYHGKDPFPMASVYKFPIALHFLHQVDGGKVRLEDSVRVTRDDLRPGHSPLAVQILKEGERTLANRELLRLMLSESDNTASDVLLRLGGGAEAVNAYLAANGVTGIRVSRSEGELALDFSGVAGAPPPGGWTYERIKRAVDAVPAERRRSAYDRFLRDPRDTAQPDAVVQLLKLVAQEQLLKPQSRKLLLDMMTQTPTGMRRLKGKLPAGTVVAHKTGSTGSHNGFVGGTNDVGLIYLPHGDVIAIAVFVKNTNADEATREGTIAETARAVYDAMNAAKKR